MQASAFGSLRVLGADTSGLKIGNQIWLEGGNWLWRHQWRLAYVSLELVRCSSCSRDERAFTSALRLPSTMSHLASTVVTLPGVNRMAPL